MTQPRSRIRYAEKEISRFRDDVEDWKRDHHQVQACWAYEDLVAKANFLYTRIIDLDQDIRESFLLQGCEFNPELDRDLSNILSNWLAASLEILPHVGALEKEYSGLDGGDDFRRNVKEAQSILTPDSEFFVGDALIELRDQAVDAHRSGLTEPLLDFTK